MSQKKMEAYKNAKKNKKETGKESQEKTYHQLDLRYCDRPSDRWRMWLSGLLY